MSSTQVTSGSSGNKKPASQTKRASGVFGQVTGSFLEPKSSALKN